MGKSRETTGISTGCSAKNVANDRRRKGGRGVQSERTKRSGRNAELQIIRPEMGKSRGIVTPGPIGVGHDLSRNNLVLFIFFALLFFVLLQACNGA